MLKYENVENGPGSDHVTWYLTKYAMTSGVMRWDGPFEWVNTDRKERYYIKVKGNLFVPGRDAFQGVTATANALAAAIEKKRKSLLKQVAALDAMVPRTMIEKAEEPPEAWR